MLTLAALGIVLFGFWSVGWAVADLATGPRLEWWADAAAIVLGLLLVLSAAFVRVRLPGGLALAIGAMLGLQALAIHAAVHLGTGLTLQIGRAALGLALVLLAYGARDEG